MTRPNIQKIDNDITIIIPCYKQSKFLLETVESCLQQTLLPRQIIILLMDSDSWRLKQELQARSPLIQTICSGQKLLPSARNFCFGVATTDFVVPLDADDTLPPIFIEELRKIDADVVYVGAKLFDAESGGWPPSMDEELDWDKQTTFRRNPIVCTALIRRTAWAAVGGYSDTLTAFEDMEFWIRLHEHGYIFKKCKETWLNYRKHSTSSMLKDVTADKKRHLQLHREIVDLHPEYYGHIPHIIHYVWMGPAPKPTALIDAWKQFLPDDWEIKEWNETNIDIESASACKLLKNAYNARKYGIAVDPVRAKVLYEYGGFWLDTDCVLKRDITPFCQYDFVIGYESEYWLNVGLVGARKGSAVMKRVIEYYDTLVFHPAAVFDHDMFIRQIGTGPHVVTETLQQLTNFIPDGMPQTIETEGQRYRIEPVCTFVLNDEPIGAHNYALHLYNASWTSEAGEWAAVVQQEYDKWKKKHKITEWRG